MSLENSEDLVLLELIFDVTVNPEPLEMCPHLRQFDLGMKKEKIIF